MPGSGASPICPWKRSSGRPTSSPSGARSSPIRSSRTRRGPGALAFNALKYLGAAYLIYLGIRKLLSKEAAEQAAATQRQPLSRAFSQGILVNLLNPKPPLFFLAFLPQFVDVSRGPAVGQTLILGLLFVGMAVITDSSYALLAGTAGRWLTDRGRFLRAQHYVTGGVYIGLGLATALSGSGKK